MTMTAHCDALGDPIVLGKRYGWSRCDNGFTQVTIGDAEKFTEKGVTFKIVSSRRCLYNDEPEILPIDKKDDWRSVKSKINVKGFSVFPIFQMQCYQCHTKESY